jgi:MSHA biogenesis protein MshP
MIFILSEAPVPPKKQSGAALIMAVIVIVVTGMLGAAMTAMLELSDEMSAREVISARALMAAGSGVNRTLECLQTTPVGGRCGACAATYVWPVTLEGLNGCSTTVTCNRDMQLIDTSGAVVESYYTLNASGTCGTAPPAVRQIQVRFRI